MIKNIVNAKLTALLIFGVFFGAVTLTAELQTKAGLFLIGGVWVKGHVTAPVVSTTTVDGVTTVSAGPPYAFHDQAGTMVEYSEIRSFEAQFQEGKGGGGDKDSKKIGKIVSTNDGLGITSVDELEVKIYDLTGECIYATIGNNISIEKNILNLRNGAYMLRLTNKEGKEERRTFIFDGISFMISK